MMPCVRLRMTNTIPRIKTVTIVDVVMLDMDVGRCGGGRQGQVPGTYRALFTDPSTIFTDSVYHYFPFIQ